MVPTLPLSRSASGSRHVLVLQGWRDAGSSPCNIGTVPKVGRYLGSSVVRGTVSYSLLRGGLILLLGGSAQLRLVLVFGTVRYLSVTT